MNKPRGWCNSQPHQTSSNMNAQRIQELDRIENELSDRLIPARGKADTVGGELLRAIERLIYRYYNDGDVLTEGYGIETCMSSYLYLQDTLDRIGLVKVTDDILGSAKWSRPECDPMLATLTNLAYDCSENDKYQDALYQLLDLIIKFIYTDPKAKEANFDDSRTWKNEEVMEMARQYEAEVYGEEEYENTERSRMLIRCVGNQVRGVLSDSYKRINSIDILVAFLQEALASDAVIADALYTETKMYVETILPTPVEIPTAKNGTVVLFAGARFSTSDFGDGALEMKSFLLNGACLNGMVRETQMRKVHIGGRLNDNLLLSQQTYDLDTKANCSAVRDITKYLYDRNTILAKAMEIEAAAEVEVDASKELKALAKAGHLYKQESEEIEKLMIQSRPDDGCQGQSTLWKLTQAITAHARDCEPRRQRELHEISGQLLSKATRK